MGLADWIADIVRHRRVNKHNQKHRGVVNYLPSQIGGFVEDDACYINTLVSGGDAQIRSETLRELCIRAYNAAMPVIVLHQGDTSCENTLRKVFAGRHNFYLANAANPVFDPLFDRTNSQICDAVVNTAPKQYKITPNARDYVSALTLTMATKSKNILLPMLVQMIRDNNVPLMIQAGTLPPAVAPKIGYLYNSGQNESKAVNHYFETLFKQCSAVLPKTVNGYAKCCTISKVMNTQGVLVLDVVSSLNNLYISLLMESLSDLVRCGKQFLLIVDGLSITEENGLKQFLSSQSNVARKVVASEDVFVSCACVPELFQTLVGQSQKWFVFHHMSDMSAMQWSKAFGMYKKIETSYTLGKGETDGSGFGIGYIGWNRNNQRNSGENIFLKDEAKVRSTEIQELKPRQGFVFTQANQELAFVTEFTQ